MARSDAPITALHNDSALLVRARRGDRDAFHELFDRLSPAAWGLAQAVARTPHDAVDATVEGFATVLRSPDDPAVPVGSRLLLATRHAAIDRIRRPEGATTTASTVTGDTVPATSPNRVVAGPEAAVVRQAFAELPERHRSILWVHEVQALGLDDAATVLELEPAAAARLAARARAGLLAHTSHVQAAGAAPACRRSSGRLASYVEGSLAPRDATILERHVAECRDCGRRLAVLGDLTTHLRASALLAPVALPFAATRRWRDVTDPFGGHNAVTQRVLAGAAALVLAGGVLGATLVNGSNGSRTELVRPANVPTALDDDDFDAPDLDLSGLPDLDLVDLSSSVAPAGDDATGTGGSDGSDPGSTDPDEVPATSSTDVDDIEATSSPDTDPVVVEDELPPTTVPRNEPEPDEPVAGSEPPASPEPPAPAPPVQTSVGGTVGDQSISLSVGECTGIELAGTTVGCTPEDGAPADDGLAIELQTPLPGLEDVSIQLP